jgi:hypothetical protein
MIDIGVRTDLVVNYYRFSFYAFASRKFWAQEWHLQLMTTGWAI